jgi:hypothetical protein
MSHRWDCPLDYEAEREGRRAGERGLSSRYSNPYSESGWQPCEEAQENWDRGFRAGERVRELREEEEREERATERRRQDAAEEEYYYQQQYEAQMQEQYPEPDPPEEQP